MKLYFLSPIIIQKIIWVPTRFSLLIFGRWKIFGLENIEGINKPIIFACNHTSEMDPFFVPASLPFFSRFSPIFYTSRERAFYNNSGWRKIFYGGLLFKTLGSYPVRVGLNDYEKSMAHHIDILKDKGSICIFPEGKISPDGTIQPGKGGVAYLAHVTGSVIIPVRFKNTFRLSFLDLLCFRRRISITYGKPLKSSGILNVDSSPDDIKNFAGQIMAEIGKL